MGPGRRRNITVQSWQKGEALISPSPGSAEIRAVTLPELGDQDALVSTLHTGVSRGTEALVLNDDVPEQIEHLMRAPFQEGRRPGPIKYGYLNVGVVEQGPAPLVGRRVFCLYPHQSRYVVPSSALTLVPQEVPSDRAVLAGTVETAINIIWDAAPRWGDRVAIVGAGLVGACVAALLRDFPLAELVLVDPDVNKEPLAQSLGLSLTPTTAMPTDLDRVIHTSATQEGLSSGLAALAVEGTLIEASWFGKTTPALPLGADFHAKRLTIRSSQVGRLAPSQMPRRTLNQRLEMALTELVDPCYDAWLTSRGDFADLPTTLAKMGTGELPGLMHVVDYPHV